MKKGFSIFSCLVVIGLCSFQSSQNGESELRVINKTFSQKEVLEYEVSYGFIKAGAATVEISQELYSVNHRTCYKVDVNGKSTGAFDMIAKINDNWGAYIDTAALVPHIAYRKLKEGGYKKYEVVKFDHQTSYLEAKTFNYQTKEFKEPRYYQFPTNVQDMISAYYYLRSLDFDTIRYKDTITVNTFFENKIYDFKILYMGKEIIETEYGKIRALILKPVMPDNKIFSGENSITAWFSDDPNKIPLKVKADLFIGSAEVTLEKAENLKTPFSIIKK